MEKYMIWYILSVKEHIKKRSSWLIVIGMFFFIWIITSISVPNYRNMYVGILCGESEAAGQIKEDLQREEAFIFIEYEDSKLLYEDVQSGRIECGFIFSEDMDEKMKNGQLRDTIQYIASIFSTKGEVLKERVYAAFFRLYSEEILEDLEPEIFGNHSEKRMQKIIERKRMYEKSDEIFRMYITEVDGETDKFQADEPINSYRGLIGLFLFLVMFLAYGKTRLKEGDSVELALGVNERYCYRYIRMLAAITLPGMASLFLLLRNVQSQGFFAESAELLIYILLCGLWISIIGNGLRKMEHMPMWMIGIVILHLLVCPVIMDFSRYIPALRVLRYLLPLGIYQMC